MDQHPNDTVTALLNSRIEDIKTTISAASAQQMGFMQMLDTTNKSAIQAQNTMIDELKKLMGRIQETLQSMPGKDDYDKLELRLNVVEQNQQKNLPIFYDMANRLPKLETRTGDLERDKSWAQGGWWMLLKIFGVISVIFGMLGWCISEYRQWILPIREKEDNAIHVQQGQ